ncbi:TPA: hypothetical protein ACH3X1_006530 [Trebouxia sp. C0004]
MAEWHTILDQLEIPDGAVAGLSASDTPVLRGKLLQLPAADRPLFFVGQPLDVLKTLCTLLPDGPSGQAQRLFNMILLCGLLQHPCASRGHSGQHLWQPTADEHIATNPSLFLGLVRSVNTGACILANETAN